MPGLGEVIEVREFGSGNLLLVQTRRDAIFRASPFVEPPVAPAQSASSVPWDLYSISFADLQKGDTIGVLAREEEGSEHTVTGLMVVTGFGSYGINALPQAPRHSGLLIRSVDEVARRRLGVSCTNGILQRQSGLSIHRNRIDFDCVSAHLASYNDS